jgi:8-oxo-dGTP pyrophosphatase MutT (NUDIX family)
MQFDTVVSRVEAALAGALPGAEAHRMLAPRPRRDWPPHFSPARIRHAAGLLLIFPIGGRAHVVLTVRADTLGRHGGQISLPGGVIERGETLAQAALREAAEEIGLEASGVKVLGELTPLDIPVSGFRLHPVVAATPVRPTFTPSDGEVAGILEIAVARLMDPSTVVHIERERDGRSIVAPSFRVDTHEIWGATAMVLAEFLALLRRNPQLS